MNALIRKEIRLLWPAYGLALWLAVAPVWLLPRGDSPLSVVAFSIGTMLLALSSFGREFSLQTIALALAQPLERRRLWWAKISVLGGALGTVYLAWSVCSTSRLYPQLGRTDWWEFLVVGAAAALVICAGGLWTTLLLRQIMAAFWFTLLIPATILICTFAYWDNRWVTFSALALYVAIACVWAWRYFLRIQEVAWTGGIIALPGWRAAAAAGGSRRAGRPVRALLRKELQLHLVSLLGMGCLFVGHLGIVLLRKLGHHTFGVSVRSALEVFGGIWLLVPLLIGSLSVAEERKLGTFEGLLALPLSRRWQCAPKLLFVLVFGGLLSALLLWSAEGLADAIGAGANFAFYLPTWTFKLAFNATSLAVLCLLFLILALLGFYVSTLTRGLIPALVGSVSGAVVLQMLADLTFRPLSLSGVWLWQGPLVHYVAWPALIAGLVGLAFRNFNRVSEGAGLWCRNVLGWVAVLAFVPAFTSAVYNRSWEYLTPLEPPPGPARLVGPKAVRLVSYDGSGLAVLLPDGRLWTDRLARDPGRRMLGFGESSGFEVGAQWLSLGGKQILGGSNWVDAAVLFRETIAIRADGTLWVSEKPRKPWDGQGLPPPEAPSGLVRFGSDTNWQSVVRPPWGSTWSVTLLRQDGTLWRWWPGPDSRAFSPQKWPGLRAFALHRLGAGTDWDRILAVANIVYAWKKNGQAWVLRPPERLAGGKQEPNELDVVIQRFEALDQHRWRSVAQSGPFQAAIGEDGRLWAWFIWGPQSAKNGGRLGAERPTQIGRDADWVGMAGGHYRLVALKADGSIWHWNLSEAPRAFVPSEVLKELVNYPPVRLGTRHDWVALGTALDGVVALAADGGLWYWWRPGRGYTEGNSDQPMLAPSRKPALIENILAGYK